MPQDPHLAPACAPRGIQSIVHATRESESNTCGVKWWSDYHRQNILHRHTASPSAAPRHATQLAPSTATAPCVSRSICSSRAASIGCGCAPRRPRTRVRRRVHVTPTAAAHTDARVSASICITTHQRRRRGVRRDSVMKGLRGPCTRHAQTHQPRAPHQLNETHHRHHDTRLLPPQRCRAIEHARDRRRRHARSWCRAVGQQRRRSTPRAH
jgi:hypothetical protein